MNDKLETVRALLRKASDPAASIEEAELYNEKARQLMARHGIEAAMLAEKGEKKDEITQNEYTFDGPYSAGRALLLSRIAAALRCKSVQWGRNATVSRKVVLGFASDLERVDVLYSSLSLQMMNQLKDIHPPPSSSDSTRSYRLSWLEGFTAEIFHRLKRAESQAANEAQTAIADGSKSTELVLLSRNERVAAAYAAAFPDLGRPKKRVRNGTGFAAGVEAGRRADLGGTSIGGVRPAIQ